MKDFNCEFMQKNIFEEFR
jgi:hypothetical protein